jgi:hypothetical protein
METLKKELNTNKGIIINKEEMSDSDIEAEDKEEKEKKEKTIDLQLSDVIKIYNPNNEILNDNTFFITYIDETKIEMVNTETFDTTILQINSNKVLGDGHITKIELLSRNKFPGYARQNNLLPGTWINIHFGGDVPSILTGEITNLEEDMIEVRTFPTNDTIYINFDYKGIPQDLPIDTIEIREKPEQKPKTPTIVEEIEEQKEYEEEATFIPELEKEKQLISERIDLAVPVYDVRTQIREFIIKADQIRFGREDLGSVVQYVSVSEEKQRYSIETQTTDLLDDLLSNIPTIQRTPTVLNNIHTMIERFKQLREMYSSFDEYGNIKDKVIFEATYKPLLSYFKNFDKNLLWVLPVVKNVKKIYNTLNVNPIGIQNSYNNEYKDIIDLNMYENLSGIESLLRSYKANELTDDNNKYSSLYSNLNPYFTPFEYIDEENSEGLIFVKDVMENITTIINNLDQFRSSVMSKDSVISKRNVIQKYNTGLSKLEAIDLSGPKFLTTKADLTKPDVMELMSFITLPEPIIRYSRVNMPGTSILDKTNLSNVPLNYWQLLKTKTNIRDLYIQALEDDIEYTEFNFANNIKNFNLDIETNSKNRDEIYNKFINVIIPKTRVLFNLMKKYITGKLSIVEVVSFLEPFLVYSDNLTYMLYKDIIRFIDEKISEYNKNLVGNFKIFLELKKLSSDKGYSIFKNAVLDMLEKKDNLNERVLQAYDIADTDLESKIYSNSEILRKIFLKDNGRLFTTAITLQNIPLMFPKELNDIIESEKERNKVNMDKVEDNGNCKKIIVAKAYKNEDLLMEDNDKDIYFDKYYDKTNYAILDDYDKEMSSMLPEAFIDFLPKALEKKYKLSPADADYLSDTLISGVKRVMDGQYAILNAKIDTSSVLLYYARKNNKWILDEDALNKDIVTSDEDIFCNLTEKCISETKALGSDCESMKLNELQLKDDLLKDIITEFDNKYYKSKDQFTKDITEKYNYDLSVLPILNYINNEKMLRSNNLKYKLGVFEDEENKEPVIISPYVKLLSLIIGQSDFVKKQNDVVRFVTEFTRTHYDGIGPLGKLESPNWLYCIKTNVPLIPTYRYDLAICFLQTPNKYIDYIQLLIKDIGKLSDDGDVWVDKHSGQMIANIDFSTDEGYDEGFKVSSRDIMEANAGDKIISVASSKQQIVMTVEVKMIIGIVNTLSVSMGINLEDQKDFIVNCVADMLRLNIPNENDYKKAVKAANDAGKTVPSFKELYNSSILYYTFGAFLIAIQVSVPPIKSRKTFPGCVRSFVGYPFDGTGDFSSVNYLSCIAYKLRSGDEPWTALKKTKEDIIAKKIKVAIDGSEKVTGLIKLPDVIRKIDEKTEFLLQNPANDIPVEHDVANWSNFLPPLVPFKLKHLVNVSPEFKSGLLKDLKSGSVNQREKILVLESKIIQFSLAIQERINEIVKKKQIILHKANNEPFLENACCNDKGNISTIQYFENEDNSITEFNTIVKGLTSILVDINSYSKGQLLYSIVDTKNIYPPLDQTFKENTIYMAFIKYCNFSNLMPISENFRPLCESKPENINVSDSIEEIIRKLKDDKRVYSNETFLRLLQIVGRENTIIMNIDTVLPNSLITLGETLEKIDHENDEIVEPALRKLMLDLLHKFSVSESDVSKETEKLVNYLVKNIEGMREDIIEFIEQNKDRSITKKVQNRAVKLLTEISLWETDKSVKNNSRISNDSLYNIINFFKLIIENLGVTFPNIILNKVDYNNVNLPSYWGLSFNHNMDLRKVISEYYEDLREFYDDNELYGVLQKMQEISKNLVLLANDTPCFTEIKNNSQTFKPIFDERISRLLFEYYLLRIFIVFIDLSDDEDMIMRIRSKPVDVIDIFSSEYLDERETRTDTDIGFTRDREQGLISGNKKKLKQKVCNLIISFMKIIENQKDTIDMSYDNIKDFVFKIREREKNTFTDRLKSMTDEERNVDNILKVTKQGVWSKGLEKGLTTYDADNYDQERDFMEMMGNIDKQLRKNKNYNGEKSNIAIDEYMEDVEAANAIDLDVQDMSNMREDYMDGDDIYFTEYGEQIDWDD